MTRYGAARDVADDLPRLLHHFAKQLDPNGAMLALQKLALGPANPETRKAQLEGAHSRAIPQIAKPTCGINGDDCDLRGRRLCVVFFLSLCACIKKYARRLK